MDRALTQPRGNLRSFTVLAAPIIIASGPCLIRHEGGHAQAQHPQDESAPSSL